MSLMMNDLTKAPAKDLSLIDRIHARALEITSCYKRAEAELIDVLQQAEEHRVFVKRGHASLFKYVVDELGLSESTAYALITVARKSRLVPELKTQLQSGEITLSNARQIVSVLTPQNQTEWLSKASTLSNRQLEKEIVKVRPKEATPERTSYVSSNRVRLELGLSEREMLRLRRVQDLMSQASRRALSLEEVIEGLNAEFLRRHDPVEKAKRHRVRNAAPVSEQNLINDDRTSAQVIGDTDKDPNSDLDTLSNSYSDSSLITLDKQLNETVKTLSTRRVPILKRIREPIPAAVLHQVNLRDQRRCSQLKRDGSRCNQTRWIEIHHKIPVSDGGTNTPDNLITLCSTHHKFAHL